MKGRTGFTLLEMLIVLTIIGILATWAVPGYLQPVDRVRSTQAGACLLELAGQLERHRLGQGSYAGFAPAQAGASCVEPLMDDYVFEAAVPGEADWGAETSDPWAWQLRARRRGQASGAAAGGLACAALVVRDDGQRGVMTAPTGPIRTDAAAVRRCWR